MSRKGLVQSYKRPKFRLRPSICSSLTCGLIARRLIRSVGSRGEAWQAAMLINFAVPILWEELAHLQEKKVGDRDLDIEWEVRHGKHQRSQSSTAGKGDFFCTRLEVAVDYANS